MIRSFADKRTEAIFNREPVKRYSLPLQQKAHRKLLLLDAADLLADLLIPPGNRLEQLVGDRAGQYSIRVDKQWRICFRWEDGIALDVELVDYH